ncbi:SGNH/GDSL hydrolase family protein [Paenibacillus sp. HB172176]|uniref:SGNH/GDSL hydrolase family protein n=1 Tax=Paenibacillus sp. HB172176 TaxID=2493690 RepID=UPI00143A7663|nr:SGNH/GDSL hydrolase family protein [Paenibacillus sp. HB172176]
MKQRWQGASWATLGDSITAANGYQPLVGEALGFARIDNKGRSGCPLALGTDRDEGATVRVAEELDEAFDCITVFAGTNDYRLHIPVGEWKGIGSEFDKNTFVGAYQFLIESLLGRFPGSRLSLWTPLQRDKDGFDSTTRNDWGSLLGDYADAVRFIGRAYALPVLDLYALSGFNKLTLDAFTSDRLHPNEAGHKRIADMAAAFLATL